jgi:hypothetical protein
MIPRDSILFRKLDTLPESTTAADIIRDCESELLKYGIKIVRREPVEKQGEFKEEFH